MKKAIIIILLLLITGCSTPKIGIPEKRQFTEEITKYTFDAVKHNGEIKEYDYNRIKHLINTSIPEKSSGWKQISEEAKEACSKVLLPYLYAFPGYSYKSIEGHAWEKKEPIQDWNVHIAFTGTETESDKTWPEKQFDSEKPAEGMGAYMFYDEGTKQCSFTQAISRRRKLLPRKIYDMALNMVELIPDINMTEIEYRYWYSGDSRYIQEMEEIDFTKPVNAIIEFMVKTEGYYVCHNVYVDVFHSEVIREGPYDCAPV
jgi:hypothetical protein